MAPQGPARRSVLVGAGRQRDRAPAQRILARFGYHAPESGVYDDVTAAMVQRFHKRFHGWSGTGSREVSKDSAALLLRVEKALGPPVLSS